MDDIYGELKKQKIIREEEENRGARVSKEDGAKYIIRAMGYEKLAEIEDIYADIFQDSKEIDPKLKGYMNLAYGLRIILGDGTDYIRPKYELNREDAASMVYNYLFN
ncbi:MAG: hypothetical protein GX185_02965 [Tissierellia bacterium]|nr:hypothetical protein [Tissierellia bacterium]